MNELEKETTWANLKYMPWVQGLFISQDISWILGKPGSPQPTTASSVLQTLSVYKILVYWENPSSIRLGSISGSPVGPTWPVIAKLAYTFASAPLAESTSLKTSISVNKSGSVGNWSKSAWHDTSIIEVKVNK